jgi:methylated-DNA-[protein]-cysteine S-methyltransferase
MIEDYDVVIRTPVGHVGLTTGAGAVTGVALATKQRCRPAGNATARRAAEELEAFFFDPAHVFEMPVQVRATPFQQRVLSLLRQIPAGSTRTYGDVARELGTSPRAVGGACRANPCPIFIPCHRVVASDGGLGGFGGRRGGEWLGIKRTLLERERARA